MKPEQLTILLALATGLVAAIGSAAAQIIREIRQGRSEAPAVVLLGKSDFQTVRPWARKSRAKRRQSPRSGAMRRR
jgi:hypothetical protein